MVREGGFSLALRANTGGRDGFAELPERTIDGRHFVEGVPGSAFEVLVRNSNRGMYKVNLHVDGKEAEPGYSSKLRGQERLKFRGFLEREGGGIHEFLFSKTPVDAAAAVGARPHTEVGEVRVEIFATREVRVESDDRGIHQNDAAFGAESALPERLAVKELGLQVRAGGQIERTDLPRPRRRGEYTSEKIEPAVVTLTLCLRDSFWFAQHEGRGAAAAPAAAAHLAAARRVAGAAAAAKRPKLEPLAGPAAAPAAGADVRVMEPTKPKVEVIDLC
jgi:hypothetical protein